MLLDTPTYEVKSTLSSEEVPMSVDEDSLVHLMTILSGIYSDIELAIVREYISNALDSHIDAKQTSPVNIFTPTKLNPYFIVQDFGIGMDAETIRNVYSKYGASTKRNSNETTGRIGIGAKSAFAYTNQFTVSANKNGVKTLVIVSKDEFGSGKMNIASQSKTTEPNGVTIKIPVNYGVDDFIEKVNEFCKYVEPGKVLVNGKRPANDDWIKVADNIYLVKRQYGWGYGNRKHDTMVMGNVSYPLAQNHDDFLRSHLVVYYAPMGSLDFTPSREALEFSLKTKAAIQEARSEISAAVSVHITKELQNQPDFPSAYEKKWQLQNEYGITLTDVSWQGRSIPNDLLNIRVADWPDDLDDREEYVSSYETTLSNIRSKYFLDYKLIVNFKCKNFTRVHARKIVKFFGDDYTESRVYFVPDDTVEFLDGVEFEDWEIIRKTQVAPPVKKEKRVKRWIGFDGVVHKEQLFEVDAKKPVYYGSRSEASGSIYNGAEIDEQFVWVTDSVKDDFLKKFPKAKHYTHYFEDKVTLYLSTLTDADRANIGYMSGCSQLRGLSSKQLDDPRLKIMCDKTNYADDSVVKEFDKYEHNYRRCSYEFRSKNPPVRSGQQSDKVIEEYPLLRAIRFGNLPSNQHNHLVEYLNWHYNNKIKDNTK